MYYTVMQWDFIWLLPDFLTNVQILNFSLSSPFCLIDTNNPFLGPWAACTWPKSRCQCFLGCSHANPLINSYWPVMDVGRAGHWAEGEIKVCIVRYNVNGREIRMPWRVIELELASCLVVELRLESCQRLHKNIQVVTMFAWTKPIHVRMHLWVVRLKCLNCLKLGPRLFCHKWRALSMFGSSIVLGISTRTKTCCNWYFGLKKQSTFSIWHWLLIYIY